MMPSRHGHQGMPPDSSVNGVLSFISIRAIPLTISFVVTGLAPCTSILMQRFDIHYLATQGNEISTEEAHKSTLKKKPGR
jgi:hypothetical protein